MPTTESMLADQVRAPTKLNSPSKLRADDPAGSLTPLCDIVLIKNDHHSFVSILERPPRCQCRFAARTRDIAECKTGRLRGARRDLCMTTRSPVCASSPGSHKSKG